ncbi:MAG: hypothetical protein ACTSXE_02715 [Candidatus Thorarchaeota archaeon]
MKDSDTYWDDPTRMSTGIRGTQELVVYPVMLSHWNKNKSVYSLAGCLANNYYTYEPPHARMLQPTKIRYWDIDELKLQLALLDCC